MENLLYVVLLCVVSLSFLDTPRGVFYKIKSFFSLLIGCGGIYYLNSLDISIFGQGTIFLCIVAISATLSGAYRPSPSVTFVFLPDGEKCEANSSPEQGEVFFDF